MPAAFIYFYKYIREGNTLEVKITDKVKIRKITKWLIGVVTSCLPYAPMVGTLVSVTALIPILD